MALKETLPTIIYIEAKHDFGEGGATNCPHCGAKGRYVYRFRCDDGTTREAMSGCIRLFSWSSLVSEHQRIIDKETSGRKLASWDREMLDAIEQCARGDIPEWQALNIIGGAKRDRTRWMISRGYR